MTNSTLIHHREARVVLETFQPKKIGEHLNNNENIREQIKNIVG